MFRSVFFLTVMDITISTTHVVIVIAIIVSLGLFTWLESL